jgi:hypothetical protein
MKFLKQQLLQHQTSHYRMKAQLRFAPENSSHHREDNAEVALNGVSMVASVVQDGESPIGVDIDDLDDAAGIMAAEDYAEVAMNCNPIVTSSIVIEGVASSTPTSPEDDREDDFKESFDMCVSAAQKQLEYAWAPLLEKKCVPSA